MKRILLVAAILLSTVADVAQEVRIYITRENVFAGRFNEPFETLCLLCYDGTIFSFTTREDERISISPPVIKEFLAKQGYEIGQIAIIIHNHFGILMMSPPDLLFWMDMIDMGFRGAFCIYSVATKNIRVWKITDSALNKK